MKKALVLSVGTGTLPGTDLAVSLAEAVESVGAERVVLLVTEESATTAQRIREALAKRRPEVVPTEVSIERFNEVGYVFTSTLQALRDLRAEGFAPDDIEADYTSGTKAMSAGLALAAVAFSCSRLHYVAGERRQGVVQRGTELFLASKPSAILAHANLRLAVQLLGELQFRAVGRMLSEDSVGLMGDYDRGLAQSLRALAEAYDAWDKFHHGQFNQPYRQADLALPELAPFRLPDAVLARVQAMHTARGSKGVREKLTADHLADLWNNAQRRRREGKFDDAVARLYRLAEMVAQYALARCDPPIDTADVQVDALAVPAEMKKRLEGQRKHGDQVKIGLQDDYEVLQALGSPVGTAFMNSVKKLECLLSKRNQSILAHGVQPVQEKDAIDLSRELWNLAETAVADLAERCAALQWPWLAEEARPSV